MGLSDALRTDRSQHNVRKRYMKGGQKSLKKALRNCMLNRSQLLYVFIISSNFDLAQHFSCSVKTVECGHIFLLACRQLRKKSQHNFIGQFYTFIESTSDVDPYFI